MYEKHKWQDRAVEYPNRYREVQENDGTVTHIKEPGRVIQEGTPMTAENFNHMEEGIFANSLLVAMVAQAYGIEVRALQEMTSGEIDELLKAAQKKIDELLKSAQDEVSTLKDDTIQVVTHAHGDKVHNLMTKDGKSAAANLRFTATADFADGDTFTLNGQSVNALMPDGNALSDKYFVTGSIVLGLYNSANNTIYFIGGGAAGCPVTVNLANERGQSSDLNGCNVKITNEEDGSVISQFAYDGQAHTVNVPIATKYRVHADDIQHYISPEDVVYTAISTPRTVTLTFTYGTRYGFKRAKNDSSPSDRITYLFDAVGKEPMDVNLTSGAPNYGDWKDFIDQLVRPVMLKTDGTVDYELDRNDQTKRADNGQASDITNTNYDGNAMVEFGGPFKWVKRYEDSDAEYVIFSNTRFEDDYHAYAHTDANGNVRDAFYWGMFKGSYVGSRMRSMGTGAVMVSTTRTEEVNRAKANGNGYYTIYKSGWDFIGDILTLLAKSDNSQAVYGSGRCKSDNKDAIACGTLKNKGAFWGSNDETSDVKVLFIEGFWGNVWEGMAGAILDAGNGIKIKMTPPYNETGAGYESTGIVPTGTSGGYVDTASVSDLTGYVPKTANGSETTHYCDGLWYNTTQVDYALVGGTWYDAGHVGSRCLNLNNLASASTATVGSRLSYLPH